MSKEVYIFEITEKSFPSAVIENSHKIPVVVAFLGVWSEHCMAVENIFSSLANEFASEFIFAKVDIDEQPELRKQYQIENVPTLIVFKGGEAARVEMGAVNEAEARALLGDFGIAHESDRLREEARQKHIAGDTAGAVMLLTQAIQKDPSNTRVAMDMVQIFIDVQQLENAEGLFNRLPERDRNSDIGKSLNDQLIFAKAAAKTEGLEILQKKVSAVPEDLDARFELSMCLMAQHEPRLALDQLVAILEADVGFKEGAAKEMMISIIRMFNATSPELANEYQRKLGSLMA